MRRKTAWIETKTNSKGSLSYQQILLYVVCFSKTFSIAYIWLDDTYYPQIPKRNIRYPNTNNITKAQSVSEINFAVAPEYLSYSL